MSEERNLPKWIPVAAAVTGLSVPFLYIFGYAYDQGHLQAYGISNDFFARSLQEYLVLSFFACLKLAKSTLESFTNGTQEVVFPLIVGGTALAVTIADKYRIVEQLTREWGFIKKHQRFDHIFFPFILVFFAFIIPQLPSAILSVPRIAYVQGQKIAENEIANAKTCAYSNTPTEGCVSLLENGKPIAAGRFVARSPSHIALFNQGKTSIYPVKDQLIEAIPPSKKPKEDAQ